MTGLGERRGWVPRRGGKTPAGCRRYRWGFARSSRQDAAAGRGEPHPRKEVVRTTSCGHGAQRAAPLHGSGWFLSETFGEGIA